MEIERGKKIEKLRQLHLRMRNLVERFPLEERNRVLFGEWSVKDILAHATAWNDLNSEHLECLKSNKDFEWVTDVDQFNAKEVARKRDLNWNEVCQSFVRSGEKLADLFWSLSGNDWNKKCGPNNKFDPKKFLEGVISHYQEHIDELASLLVS